MRVPVSFGLALRWFRAALTATVVVQLGAVAHVMAGGVLPEATTMVPLVAGVLLMCGMVLARPSSTRRIVLLLVAGQTLVHGVMTMAAGHVGDGVPSSTGGAGVEAPDLTHLHASADPGVPTFQRLSDGAAPEPGSASLVSEPVAHLLADLTGAHAPMAVAHVLAAALVGLWLARGERALVALLGLLATALPALVVALAPLMVTWDRSRLARPAPGRGTEREIDSLLTGRRSDASRARTRRGPPALLPV